MKRYLKIFLLISTLASCEKEKVNTIESSFFWSPIIKVDKGDKEANLSLIDPRPFTTYRYPGPSNPDRFKIFISDDDENFSLYSEVDISTNSIPVENLLNGNSYYFIVASYKANQDSIISHSVMTIPSARLETETYLTNSDFSIERLSMSFDMSYISFRSNKSGNEMFYYKAKTLDEISLIANNAHSPDWSPTANQLVYLTSIKEGNAIFPYKLKIFEPGINKTTTLFEVPYNNYYISSPTHIPDGSKIAFLSSENNSEKHIYNIWTIDPVTKVKLKITNFESVGFYTDSKFDWTASGEEIYLNGRYDNFNNDIYKMNILTQSLIPVIESHWSEKTPSLSPDNSKIIFVSDRTGNNEIWLFDLISLKYKQITGGSAYYFNSRNSNLEWINNEQVLITVFDGSKTIAVKINLN